MKIGVQISINLLRSCVRRLKYIIVEKIKYSNTVKKLNNPKVNP